MFGVLAFHTGALQLLQAILRKPDSLLILLLVAPFIWFSPHGP